MSYSYALAITGSPADLDGLPRKLRLSKHRLPTSGDRIVIAETVTDSAEDILDAVQVLAEEYPALQWVLATFDTSTTSFSECLRYADGKLVSHEEPVETG